MRNYVLATAAAAALLGVVSVSQAEPMTLDAQQLDTITAGANTAGGHTLARVSSRTCSRTGRHRRTGRRIHLPRHSA